MFVIQEMLILHYDEVIKLWEQTKNMSLREVDSRENIASYLEQNRGLSFVAISANRIIGAILVGTDGRRGYIQHLAVSTEFRGNGIGKALIDKSINALSQRGISKTHLFVLNDNLKAQSFYEKLGWHSRDELRMFSYYSSGNLNA